MKDEFDELDDERLYASFDAYKTLLDAGLSKKEAMERTGLTAQIIKDLEEEENEMDFRSEFKEVWDSGDDDDIEGGDWNKEDEFAGDDSWDDGFEDDGGYEDKDYY